MVSAVDDEASKMEKNVILRYKFIKMSYIQWRYPDGRAKKNYKRELRRMP